MSIAIIILCTIGNQITSKNASYALIEVTILLKSMIFSLPALLFLLNKYRSENSPQKVVLKNNVCIVSATEFFSCSARQML